MALDIFIAKGGIGTGMKLQQQRTCIACRTTESRQGLIRWVLSGDVSPRAVRLDIAATATGRGAWTHADQQCVRKAVQRKAFHRAFRAPVNDASVLEQFAAHEDLPAAGRKSGRDKESGSEI
ncbi:YlxR family protein [Glutamicibacter endophyticus]|uniref:YlxR family protein n=1 Tax=Glutamicibacter endophyticus TaxID=1522174 RepID=UPI003AF14370